MTTFIGDIHGWCDRLDRLREQVTGPVVLLGDLIDRGADSAGVIVQVRAWCEQGDAQVVLGNHEYALVRGLGCAAYQIEPDPALYQAWWMYYGGKETCESYQVVPHRAEDLRRAMGDDLDWLAGLPWVIEGEADQGKAWIAVHAGLDGVRPLAVQLAELRNPPAAWWEPASSLPGPLYAKDRVPLLPPDLPANTVLVSGHVPLEQALVTPQRIICDTTGGRVGRRLSAVVWPSGRVLRS